MLSPPKTTESRFFPRDVLIGLTVTGLLILYLYGFHGNAEQVQLHGRSAILWMTARWNSHYETDLSFGWLIPLVSAFVIWSRRKALLEVPVAPDARGYALVILALFFYWAGLQGQQTRLVLFSLLLLLWGIPFTLWGSKVAEQLIFPVTYLSFCVPFSFLYSFTFPLRLFGAKVSAVMLNGLGVACIRVGTAIHSAAPDGFHFDVADPCSGLRSILAMTALTAVYAHFTQKGPVRQWLLFLAAFPLAIAANIIRIVMIGVASVAFGQKWATGFYHDYSSYVFFVSAILLMRWLGSLIQLDWSALWKKNTP